MYYEAEAPADLHSVLDFCHTMWSTRTPTVRKKTTGRLIIADALCLVHLLRRSSSAAACGAKRRAGHMDPRDRCAKATAPRRQATDRHIKNRTGTAGAPPTQTNGRAPAESSVARRHGGR
jgi:hypothetical protein